LKLKVSDFNASFDPIDPIKEFFEIAGDGLIFDVGCCMVEAVWRPKLKLAATRQKKFAFRRQRDYTGEVF